MGILWEYYGNTSMNYRHCTTCIGTVRPKSKQGTTNLNNSFSMENEKRAAQVDPCQTAYEAHALPTELPRQLNWLG